MSRVFGIVSGLDINVKSQILSRIKVSLSNNQDWQVDERIIGSTVLGYCGWHTSNIAAENGLLAVMDGAIFNRDDFEKFENDALLFLYLYRKYGFTKAIQNINGDFVIGLFDANENTLWLARDRIGVKPLYYLLKENTFAFASQPRALLAIPGVSREVNKQFVSLFAASHYRYFDNEPNASPYVDILQLPAGHILCFRDKKTSLTSYWSLEDKPDFVDSEEVLAEKYRDLLIDAVDLRLRNSKRTCFTLSGGMDSSSVLASAVLVSSAKQHAFSTIYVDKTYDESEEIRSMLDLTVEQWHPLSIDDNPDVFGLIEEMISAHDEPVATATWLSHFLLCKDIQSQGFGSVFGGLGGDELNAGEYEYFTYFFADLKSAGKELQLSRELDFWIRYHDHPIFRKSQKVLDENFKRMVDLERPGFCLPDRTRLERYISSLNKDYFDLRSFSPVMDHPFKSYLKNRTYQDMFRETVPCCLRAEDRQATACGLDNYLPFFDYRLVEFMFQVPGEYKYRDGVTKNLLRNAMKGILPEETRTRIKKTGWNAPAHKWFSSGRGGDMLLDLVNSRSFKERGIYSVPEVIRLIEDHTTIVENGLVVENHMMFLWQLVNLELWLQALERE